MNVLVEAPELRAELRTRGTAESRAHRIEKDEIQQRELIVLVGIGRRRIGAVGIQTNLLRPERTHVEPHRRRAGPTIEHEAQWSRARIAYTVLVIRDEKNSAFDCTGRVIADRKHSRRRRVAQRRAMEPDGMARHHRRRFDHREKVARAGPQRVPHGGAKRIADRTRARVARRGARLTRLSHGGGRTYRDGRDDESDTADLEPREVSHGK